MTRRWVHRPSRRAALVYAALFLPLAACLGERETIRVGPCPVIPPAPAPPIEFEGPWPGTDRDRAAVLNHTQLTSGMGFFPVVQRLEGGRLITVLRGNPLHLDRAGNLKTIHSDDEGAHWTNLSMVVDTGGDDRNPAVGEALDGAIVVVFWRTNNYQPDGTYDANISDAGIWVTRSSDCGSTWSEPTEIDISDLAWGSPFGKIWTLPDGSMWLNIYGSVVVGRDAPHVYDNFVGSSHLYRSLDGGRNWTRFSTIGGGAGIQFGETALLPMGGGHWMAAMRMRNATIPSRNAQLWVTVSKDQAVTWSAPVQVTPAYVAPGDLTLLPDGRVLFVVTERRGPFGVRALVGDQEGHFDWNTSFSLVNDSLDLDTGYPSSLVYPDGRIVTVYYAAGSATHRDWGVHAAALTWRLRGPAL